jgi:tungstate transport system substrate-binding protein
VPAPESEKQWMAQGSGTERLLVMHNDFILVGPPDDPASLKGTPSAVDAFTRMAAAQAPFVSRGDNSGTQQAELALWRQAHVDP